MSQTLDESDVQSTTPPVEPSIEEVAPGVTLEWLLDRRVAAFTFKTAVRESIDRARDKMKAVMENWPADHLYLGITDFSDPKLGLTPYVRERVKEPATWRPELRGYVALVMPRTFAAQLVQLALQAQRNDSRQVRAFFDREAAIAWLKSKL
jgi:hypothetical protein